jgi:hypothetical protein
MVRETSWGALGGLPPSVDGLSCHDCPDPVFIEFVRPGVAGMSIVPLGEHRLILGQCHLVISCAHHGAVGQDLSFVEAFWRFACDAVADGLFF